MTRHDTPRRVPQALLAAIAIASTGVVAAEAPLSVGPAEADAHLIGPRPVIPLPWQDLTSEWAPGWAFTIHVDATGRVIDAKIDDGSPKLRDQATRAVMAMRFQPFQLDGRDVPATIGYILDSAVADYDGPADRGFPLHPDPAGVHIALRRTSCFGSCPSYRVELRGDGEVAYVGEDNVLVRGEQRWRIAPDRIAPLLALLRESNYLGLAGHYQIDATDLPTQTTSVSVEGRRKFVVDYGGELSGVVASTSAGEPAVPMPAAVVQIERSIDAIAGTESWTRGDEHTMARLRAANWDFRSADAGRALVQLVGDCKAALAQDFLRAGAPIDGQRENGHGIGLPAGAAVCGDAGLVAALDARGLLADHDAAQSFLESSVRSGYPDFVAIALQHGADAKRLDRYGAGLVAEAAKDVHHDDRPPGDATIDSARVIALLNAAGAPCDAPDKEGNRALHRVSGAAVARALLAAGADPNARNAAGQTPLFTQDAADAIPVLLAAGADLRARDRARRTALHGQQWPQVVVALVKAGADVEATDAQGRTPLETAIDEQTALALLDAGARVPADAARRAELVEHATKARWTKLLARLGMPAS